MDTWPEGYVELLRRPDRSYCNERYLVLRAIGVDARTVFDDGAFALIVPAEQALHSANELIQYDAEDRSPPASIEPLPQRGSGLYGLALYAVCLLLVAILQRQHFFSANWLEIGALDVEQLRQGEWWRLITALTLHLDTAHLLGNLVVGGVFAVFLGRLLGDGLAWFCILLAASAGNAMDALLQADHFAAAGASTAVFATLGLLCGYSWRLRQASRVRWALRWAPLVGGVVLLAWFGTGDQKTDIVAHLTGFLAGTGLGALLPGLLAGKLAGPGLQRALGMLTLVVVTGAWLLALTHGAQR
jgi:membrane associated rhomboid family serine protease